MNILLTGGAGYIGSHTAIALIDAGHRVFIYDNLCNCSISTIERIEKIANKKIDFIRGDIRDAELLKLTLARYSIDAVIHFAGLKAVGESVAMPLEYYENNVAGTMVLLSVMNELQIKNLVFSSSATVYGDPQYLPIDEAHPLGPTNPHGRTKLQIEQILEDVSKSDPDWKIVNFRYFNPVGAHPSGLLGEDPQSVPNNLMPFIARVADGELAELSVFGDRYKTIDGTGVRDYIHVMDLADGHISALNFLESVKGFESFNLGTGNGFSVLQMIEFYEKACGKKIPYQVVENRPGDIASCYASSHKANQMLNWKALRTLDDMFVSSWFFQQKIHSTTT